MVPRLGSAKFIRTIDEIIAALSPKHSSVEEFALSGEEEWVKVGKEGATMMPLSIESTTWQGTPSISVMHYYIQNGDLMNDPMVVVTTSGEPMEWQQDGMPGRYGYQRWDVGANTRDKRDCVKFLDQWAENLYAMWLPMAREQGHAAA